jgi:hypothetical protein
MAALARHWHGSNGPVLNDVQLGATRITMNNTAEILSNATKSCSRRVNRRQSASNIDLLQIRICECEQLTVMVSEPQFWLRLSAPFSGEQSLLFVSKQSISKEALGEMCLRDQRNLEDSSTDLLSRSEDTS